MPPHPPYWHNTTCTSDISPRVSYPDTHYTTFFPHWENLVACRHVRLAPTPPPLGSPRHRSAHPFNSFHVGVKFRRLVKGLCYPIFTLVFFCINFGFSLDYSWIFVMASQLPNTAMPPSTSALSSPAVDVSAHRSCQRCARWMSSYKYDKHTICNQCRDVNCAVDVRCSECSSWTADAMQEYLKHCKSLVSKGRKKPASATPSSSPSLTLVVSTVSSLVSQPVCYLS